MSPTAVLLLVACTVFSCGTDQEKSEREQIIKLLDRRQKGLEENDPQLYLSAVSGDYNDGIDTYSTLKTKVEKFKRSNWKIKIKNRTIYIAENQATVVEEYHLDGHLPSGTKLDTDRQAILRLEYGEAHGWKIVNGINDFSFAPQTGRLPSPR